MDLALPGSSMDPEHALPVNRINVTKARILRGVLKFVGGRYVLIMNIKGVFIIGILIFLFFVVVLISLPKFSHIFNGICNCI